MVGECLEGSFILLGSDVPGGDSAGQVHALIG